jgi:hypothetical protein
MIRKPQFLLIAAVLLGSLAASAEAQGPLRKWIQKRRSTAAVNVDCGPGGCVVMPTAAPMPAVMLPTVAPAPVAVATVSIVDAPVETASGFKGQLIAAISKARQAGDITFREALALRVACFSPSFVESAEKLAITQMAFSEQGAEYLPMSADGTIDQTAIDWENFGTFIERLVPIILTLLEAFGVI